MNPNHLPRLQSLHRENPTKRIRLISIAWPDIEKALARGHTLKLVHSRLIEDGLGISYSLLSLYVRRLQGKDSAKKHHPFEKSNTGSPVKATDRPGKNRNTDEDKNAARLPATHAVPVEDLQGIGLSEPSELSLDAIKNGRGPQGREDRCFFQEVVPDINKLFRVTRST